LNDIRAFLAASLKEWRVVRRYPLYFAGMVFWPLVLPGVYVLQANGFSGGDPRALQAFTERAGTAQVAAFLYIGWAMYMWLSNVLWGPGTSLRQQQVQGQLEAIFLTPASRAAVLFGPAGSSLVMVLWMFLVVGLVVHFAFGLALGPAAVARALAVILLGLPAIYGMGALFSIAVLRYREVNGLVQLVRGLCQVFCGMTFPIVVLPDWARAVALTLPPTYVIADIRAVLLTGSDLARLAPTFGFLLVAGAVLCGLAALGLRSTEGYARRGGSLVQY
jgi:ABC-2 type transport system permease protein